MTSLGLSATSVATSRDLKAPKIGEVCRMPTESVELAQTNAHVHHHAYPIACFLSNVIEGDIAPPPPRSCTVSHINKRGKTLFTYLHGPSPYQVYVVKVYIAD